MCQKKFAGIALRAIPLLRKGSQMPSHRHQRDPLCCRSLEPESFSRKVASRKHVSFSSICRNNLVQKNRIAGELADLHLSTLAVASISLTIVPGERVSHLPTYFRPTACSPSVHLH